MRVLDSLLALLVIVVVLAVVGWVFLGRKETPGKRPVRYRRRSPWLRRLPVLFVLVAVAFLALAFTQFRFLREESSAGTVVLAMDVSESMGRDDVEPTRLEAAKAAARLFLDRLPTDLRVGLVTFAAEAEEVVAPTLEREQLVAALDDLPRTEGTVIGDGLTRAIDSVVAARAQGGETAAAIVLLSDGRDTGSTVPPTEAARRAADLGVGVYTVVLGRALDTGGGGANVMLLEEIAQETGASSYTADTAAGLLQVYETLESEISTELAISDYGALFVAIAALFAIAATVTILLSLRTEY